jgi:hypothetical protein
MGPVQAIRSLSALFLTLAIFTGSPSATAEGVAIQPAWIQPSCQNHQCLHRGYGLMLSVPKHWRVQASKNPHYVILVPAGHCLYCDQAPRIELFVEFNAEHKTISQFADGQFAFWRAEIPDVKIEPGADIAGVDGRESFKVFEIESREHHRVEQIALATQIDAKGNTLLISGNLSANSRRMLSATRAIFAAVLQSIELR